MVGGAQRCRPASRADGSRGRSSSALGWAGPHQHHLLGAKSPSAPHPRIRDGALGMEWGTLAGSSWDKNNGIVFMWDKLCGTPPGRRSLLLLQFAPMLTGHRGAETSALRWKKEEAVPCRRSAAPCAYPGVDGMDFHSLQWSLPRFTPA